MRTVFGPLFLTLAVAASAPAAEPPSPANAGRVLVLDNQRALEGDIRFEAGQYRVRRTVGEVWLPEDKALKLCAGWEEAFAFLVSQANLRDPDEHLRLARWCMVYGLREHALAEATAAVQMRPSHAASRQLLTLLQRSPSVVQTAPAPRPPQVAQAAASAAPAIDLSAEAVSMFTTRVQPVLMNTCASCHATDRATVFKLCRASGSSTASRRAMQQNLAATLAQLDPDHPHASPLLLRAVIDHGKSGQAPLKAQSLPYRILQEWIDVALATNPFLREQHRLSPAAAAVTTVPPARSFPAETSVAEAPTTLPALVPMIAAAAPIVSTSEPRPASPEQLPARVAPADDFDPAPFNQQWHPQPPGASGS